MAVEWLCSCIHQGIRYVYGLNPEWKAHKLKWGLHVTVSGRKLSTRAGQAYRTLFSGSVSLTVQCFLTAGNGPYYSIQFPINHTTGFLFINENNRNQYFLKGYRKKLFLVFRWDNLFPFVQSINIFGPLSLALLCFHSAVCSRVWRNELRGEQFL